VERYSSTPEILDAHVGTVTRNLGGIQRTVAQVVVRRRFNVTTRLNE
jgi:hypothetical protein